jgi:hypothetical protein
VRFFLIILLFTFIANSYGQKHLALQKVLEKQFPAISQQVFAESEEITRWVFYSDHSNIEKINKPLVKTIVKQYDFYKVNMINYLGYHINKVTCLILFDSVKSKILLVAPLWYGGPGQSFMKLFMGKKFDDRNSLLNFLTQLNDLMEIGSIYRYVETSSNDSLITYDLAYIKSTSITSGDGLPSTSTIRYNENGVWRKIRVQIKNRAIIRYTSINPVSSEKEIFE